jgi:phosphoenolpyruvate carboxykinase (GTP)
MNAYLEVLKSRIEPKHYERLMKIESPTLHAFVAKYIDLCEPDRVYVSAETEELMLCVELM